MGIVIRLFGLVGLLGGLASSAPYRILNPPFGQPPTGSSFGIPGRAATYDYVIVGGGTAGLTVASRLVEQNAGSVAVLEAGSFYEISNGNQSEVPGFGAIYSGKDVHDWQPLIDWGYITVPQEGALGAPMHYARGKTLGGSSARNFMVYHRGTKGSYDKWARQVGDDSFKFEKLLPYFEKSLNFTPPRNDLRPANATPHFDAAVLGDRHGPVDVAYPNYASAYGSWTVKALEELGMHEIPGFNSGKLVGQAYTLFNIQGDTMRRETSESAFLQSTLEAIGVDVDTAGARYTISARKEVILSAGAFGSPQLLQVSGIGPAKLLKGLGIPVLADRKGVGQNMQDHILFGVSHAVHALTASSLSNPAVLAEQVRLFNEEARGMLSSPGVDVIGWEHLPRESLSKSTTDVLNKEYPEDWPDVEYLPGPAFLGDQNLVSDPNDGHNYASMVPILVKPRSRGTVTITSADAAVHPAIDPRFLTDQVDVDVAVMAFKRARAFWQTKAMREFSDPTEAYPGEDVRTDEQIATSIRKSYNTVWHAACTCAMGKPNDPAAVVDTQGRVYGVKKLRVVDASALPFLPPGHPIATIYALAEKISCNISGNC
ncbi:versicolorin B synthase [Apiospora arundinis]